jgi:hypothetical protein
MTWKCWSEVVGAFLDAEEVRGHGEAIGAPLEELLSELEEKGGPAGGDRRAAWEVAINVEAETVHQMLEGEKAKGRSNVEAAGIALWLKNEQHRRELLSDQTRREAEGVILDWLRSDAGEESSAGRELAARQLAQFLSEHVDIAVAEPPDIKVEPALRRWRQARGSAAGETWPGRLLIELEEKELGPLGSHRGLVHGDEPRRCKDGSRRSIGSTRLRRSGYGLRHERQPLRRRGDRE